MTAVVQEGIRWSVMIKSVWDLSFRLFGGGPVPCRRYTRRRRSTRDPGSYSALASRTHIRTTRMSPPSASTVQCVINSISSSWRILMRFWHALVRSPRSDNCGETSYQVGGDEPPAPLLRSTLGGSSRGPRALHLHCRGGRSPLSFGDEKMTALQHERFEEAFSSGRIEGREVSFGRSGNTILRILGNIGAVYEAKGNPERAAYFYELADSQSPADEDLMFQIYKEAGQGAGLNAPSAGASGA